MLTFQESLHNLFEGGAEENEFKYDKKMLTRALSIVIKEIKRAYGSPARLKHMAEIERQIQLMEGGNAQSAEWLGAQLVTYIQFAGTMFSKQWAQTIGKKISQYMQPQPQPQQPQPQSQQQQPQQRQPQSGGQEWESVNEEKFDKTLAEIITAMA